MFSKISLACAGAFAAAATYAGTAFAAEPVPPPPPAFTWTGLYVGAQIGYAWGHDNVTWSGFSEDDDLAAGTFSQTPQGVIGGAHVGYNLQYNSWLVFGLEGSVDGTSLSHTLAVPVNDFAFDTPGIITSRSEADVQGSLRGRVGIFIASSRVRSRVPWNSSSSLVTRATCSESGCPRLSAECCRRSRPPKLRPFSRRSKAQSSTGRR